MAFDYGAYGRSNLSASSPTDQELDYHYGLSLEEWARDKPLSILQLDPADRAVLRIAGTQAPLENFSLQLSLKSWFRSVEHTAGYSRCPFFFPKNSLWILFGFQCVMHTKMGVTITFYL